MWLTFSFDLTSQVCSRNRYAFVRDFGWYLSLLVNKVCRVDSSQFEEQIAAQLVAVVVRVPPVQKLAVQMLLPFLGAGDENDPSAPMVCLEAVVRAAAWIVAEYSDNMGQKPARTAATLRKVFDLLVSECMPLCHKLQAWVLMNTSCAVQINSRTQSLPIATQSVFVNAALKLFLRIIAILQKENNGVLVSPNVHTTARQLQDVITEHALPLSGAADASNELRVRVHNLVQAANVAVTASATGGDLLSGDQSNSETGDAEPADSSSSLVQRLLKFAAVRAAPVSAKAQSRVAIPEGLRLKKWVSKTAKRRAIASRNQILDQRSGVYEGKPPKFSLANLRIAPKEDDDDDDAKEDDDDNSGNGDADAGDDSSDEFAQFRDNKDGDSSSSEEEVSTDAKKRNIFYLGGAPSKGKKGKKSKKKKKSQREKGSDAGSPASTGNVSNMADLFPEQNSQPAPITASVVLGSDDEDDNNGTSQTVDALASIDLSSPNNDGLSFESLKQKHRTDTVAAPAAPPPSSGKKDKKKKDKKKKDKKKKDKRKKKDESAQETPSAPAVDLLNFDAPAPAPAPAPDMMADLFGDISSPAASPAAATAAPVVEEELQSPSNTAADTTNDGAAEKTSKSDKKSKKKGSKKEKKSKKDKKKSKSKS